MGIINYDEFNWKVQWQKEGRCPKALQNLALANDPIIGIIGTIVSNFLITLSIINAFSSI